MGKRCQQLLGLPLAAAHRHAHPVAQLCQRPLERALVCGGGGRVVVVEGGVGGWGWGSGQAVSGCSAARPGMPIWLPTQAGRRAGNHKPGTQEKQAGRQAQHTAQGPLSWEAGGAPCREDGSPATRSPLAVKV